MKQAKLHNLSLKIAYEGTEFFGWQKTPFGHSVEGNLENALFLLLKERVALQSASRTDRGVHAEEQVVNFLTSQDSLDLKKLQRSLNGLLPSSIVVLSIEEKPLSFHATLDAIAKEYHYFLSYHTILPPHLLHRFWHYGYPLDVDKMKRASKDFIGLHDFSSFCNLSKNGSELVLSCESSHLRHLFRIDIIPIGEKQLRIEIVGNRFLYRMVRNIVGTLVYIGRGLLEEIAIPKILESKERKHAGLTAPAQGLFLAKIFYSNNCPHTYTKEPLIKSLSERLSKIFD